VTTAAVVVLRVIDAPSGLIIFSKALSITPS
jgi:hypothetical protein